MVLGKSSLNLDQEKIMPKLAVIKLANPILLFGFFNFLKNP